MCRGISSLVYRRLNRHLSFANGERRDLSVIFARSYKQVPATVRSLVARQRRLLGMTLKKLRRLLGMTS